MSTGIIWQPIDPIEYSIDHNVLITEAGSYSFHSILENELPSPISPNSVAVVIGDTPEKQIVTNLLKHAQMTETSIERGLSMYECQFEDGAPSTVWELSYDADCFNLSTLTGVLLDMARNSRYVPYRNTTFTRLLWPELVKNARTFGKDGTDCSLRVYIHLPMDTGEAQTCQQAIAEAFQLWSESRSKSVQQYVPASSLNMNIDDMRTAVRSRLDLLKQRYMAEYMPKYEAHRELLAESTKQAKLQLVEDHKAAKIRLNELIFENEKLQLEKRTLEGQLRRYIARPLMPLNDGHLNSTSNKDDRQRHTDQLGKTLYSVEDGESSPLYENTGVKSLEMSEADVTVDPWDLIFNDRENEIYLRQRENERMRSQVSSLAARLYDQVCSSN